MELLVLYKIPPLLSSIFFLFLGSIVYFKNRRSPLNITFTLVCLVTFWWQFSWFILFNTQSESLANFLVRFGYIGIIFIPIFFFHFVLSFLHNVSKFDKYLLHFAYCSGLIFELLLPTKLFIDGFYKYFWGFYPKAGILHPIYLFLLTVLAVRGLYLLISSLVKKKKLIPITQKYQIEYFLLALIFYIFASSDFLVNYGIEFYPLGFLFILFFLGIIAFAITRYHLFEIRVILTEILVGGMGIILLVLLFLMPTGGLRMLLGIVLVLFLIFGYLLIKYTYEQERRRQVAEEIAEKERKLRQRAERIAHELQHLNQIRNQMFLTGQHHTRTPLSNIKNFASVLLSGGYGPINKEQKHALEVIMSQVNQSIELANLYLSVSQFEAGRALLKKERTDICQLIKEQIEKLKIEAQAKGVKIITRFEKDIPQAEVDKAQLGLSIFAIIDNAIKYSPRGRGRVEVSIKKKDHNRILLSFKDNGIGIAKENIDYIGRFAFQRTERAKRIHGTGKGLALYFANLVVKEHKGKLWVESEGPNKGATFYIELPVK